MRQSTHGHPFSLPTRPSSVSPPSLSSAARTRGLVLVLVSAQRVPARRRLRPPQQDLRKLNPSALLLLFTHQYPLAQLSSLHLESDSFGVSAFPMSSQVSTSRGLHPPGKIMTFESPHSWPLSAPTGQAEPGSNDDQDLRLLSVSWNQDCGCFAAGTSNGFRIFNCNPFRETFRRDLNSGGFGIVEMLFRCNILALVGGGSNVQYPSNKVIIWDDHKSRCIGEFTFRSDVRAVKLGKDNIVIVLDTKIYVHQLADLKMLHQIDTQPNPGGLCCLSHHSNTSVLACPGLRQGHVRVEHFGLNLTKMIPAHDSHIACMALTMDGLLLATASMKGTLIRIFNTMDGSLLQEVRRGLDKAEIYSIALSPNVQWLAVSSDKGTVHIFSLKVRVAGEDAINDLRTLEAHRIDHQNSSSSMDPLIQTNTGSNASSSLSFMKGILPKYFSSEWSFAQFHLPEVTRYIVAFGAQNTVMMVGLDGSFYRCIFDQVNGGQMSQKEYSRFLKADYAPLRARTV